MSIAPAIDRLVEAINNVDNKIGSIGGWQRISTVTDLNTLVTPGNYYIDKASTNTPVNTAFYISVIKIEERRGLSPKILQTVRSAYDPSLEYVRANYGRWGKWEQMMSSTEVDNRLKPLIARIEALEAPVPS